MQQETNPWASEGIDLLRGAGGGIITGMPLLYTMEVWWIGMYVTDWHIAGFLLFALIINMGLNHIAGFEEGHNIWLDIRDSIVAIGAGAVISLVVLTLLNVIHSGISFSAAVSIVALAATTVSIGFSIANTQFSGSHTEEQNDGSPSAGTEKQRAMIDLVDMGLAAAGASIFVLALVPTEEIIMITARTTGFHWAALVVFSLLITYSIVFVADFTGAKGRREHEGLMQQPVPETIIAYTVSVLVSLLLLFLLGRTEVFSSVAAVVGHSAVVGLPAAVGGAAARLII